MDKRGYILLAPQYTDVARDKMWMKNFGCNEIIIEEYPKNGKSRELWNRLLARIQPGDTLVIPKLSNALKSARQLVFFLEFCRIQNVRLVSIHDKIDSGDEMFPETKTSDVLTGDCIVAEGSQCCEGSIKAFPTDKKEDKADVEETARQGRKKPKDCQHVP